jgi:DNA-directed RNA polymerase subunit RPC12/RpoP
MNTTTCEKCGKDFEYKITDMNVPGGKEREYINCPYCGESNGSVVTSGLVYSYRLEDQD